MLTAGQRLELLIVQSTKFCNIDCKYCYLPDRNSRGVMPYGTLQALLGRVAAHPTLIQDGFTICWHAGEPLAAGLEFYLNATQAIEKCVPRNVKVIQSIQTNATQINKSWCEYFRRYGVRIGVSLDGPLEMHDANRKDRRFRGTHAAVMRGVHLLKEAAIDFSVIAVVTRPTIADPDGFYNFFRDTGIRRVGLNIAEIENANRYSEVLEGGHELEYLAFLKRIYQRSLLDGEVEFRELASLWDGIRYGNDTQGEDGRSASQTTEPFSILTCAIDGAVSTFSPELLGAKSNLYGDFKIGNVHTDSLDEMMVNPPLARMVEDIRAGIALCRSKCSYYGICKGGAPSNKFFEHGTFAAADTMACRYSKKIVITAALSAIGYHLSNSQPRISPL